jgi:hypothetical protein
MPLKVAATAAAEAAAAGGSGGGGESAPSPYPDFVYGVAAFLIAQGPYCYFGASSGWLDNNWAWNGHRGPPPPPHTHTHPHSATAAATAAIVPSDTFVSPNLTPSFLPFPISVCAQIKMTGSLVSRLDPLSGCRTTNGSVAWRRPTCRSTHRAAVALSRLAAAEYCAHRSPATCSNWNECNCESCFSRSSVDKQTPLVMPRFLGPSFWLRQCCLALFAAPACRAQPPCTQGLAFKAPMLPSSPVAPPAIAAGAEGQACAWARHAAPGCTGVHVRKRVHADARGCCNLHAHGGTRLNSTHNPAMCGAVMRHDASTFPPSPPPGQPAAGANVLHIIVDDLRPDLAPFGPAFHAHARSGGVRPQRHSV